MSRKRSYPRLPFFVRFYSWHELPRWHVVMGKLHAVGVEFEPLWRDAPVRSARGKLHGYTMDLDLSHWSDRFVYFVGRFVDIPTELALQAVIRPGDTFVDVGANTGMLSLLGARLVGPSGLVLAVEPNPQLAERIRATSKLNHLDHLRVIEAALSDTPSTSKFFLSEEDHTLGTLASSADSPEKQSCIDVEVLTGDDLLESAPQGGVTIKIDVEGFECRVVNGMRRLIQERRPTIITETLDFMLEAGGGSLAELYGLFKELGYKGFGLGSRKKPFFPSKLVLYPTDEPDASWDNVLWVNQETDTFSRIERHIVRAPVE